MKTGAFQRSLDLIGLAAKVGFKEITSKGMSSRVEQAKLIVQTLSQLKGAAMKAGQLMSLDLNDYFPPEAIEILSKLQNQAQFLSYEKIELQLQRELAEKFSELENLIRQPLAAASIGQVHQARWQKQNIVLKVQYPGVAESIDSDLKVLQKLAESLAKMSGRSVPLGPVFEELRQTLLDETDYRKEAANLLDYESLLAKDKELRSRLRTPKLIEHLSTAKVLALSHEDGITINEWLTKQPVLSERTKMADLVLKLYGKEFYSWGLVQTDPNLANFLVQDGANQVCLLDFGATKKYSDQFRKDYKNFLRKVPSTNPKEIIDAAVEFQLLDPRETLDSKMKFHDFMKHSIEPFFVKSTGGQFYFGDAKYSETSRRLSREFVFALKYTPPPSKILFLHRKLGGIFALLRRMDVSLNLQTYWEELLAESA